MIIVHNKLKVNKYRDIIWFRESLDEKLFELKKLKKEYFQYHVIEERDETILYLPTVPIRVLRKFMSQNLNFVFYISNENRNYQLKYDDDYKGFKISNPDINPVGTCKIKNSDFHSELEFFIAERIRHLQWTLDHFIESYRIYLHKWRNNLILSQRNKLPDLGQQQLSLKIIEGIAGTGKTYDIIEDIKSYPRRAVVSVSGDGPLITYQERLEDEGLDFFIYNKPSLIEKKKNYIEKKIKDNISNDEEIEKLQEEWLSLINKKGKVQDFFISFSPVILVDNFYAQKFLYHYHSLKFQKIFIDDANVFHPWNILEIFPFSENIFTAGDPSQLTPPKDFDFIADRLGFKENTVVVSAPDPETLTGAEYIPMDLDEKLNMALYMGGKIKEIAKQVQSGISFSHIFDESSQDIEEFGRKIESLKDRSLFTISKQWPTKGKIIPPIKTKLYRYKGYYMDVLRYLGIFDGTFKTITKSKVTRISELACIPITFIDFPEGSLERTTGRSFTKINITEADHVKNIALQVLENSEYSVLVITGYGGQFLHFQNILSSEKDIYGRRLKILHARNSSSFEQDIVIISLTRNNPRKNIGWMEDNLISMMFKRARYGAIIVGCSYTFEQVSETRISKERKIVQLAKKLSKRLESYHPYIGDVNE